MTGAPLRFGERARVVEPEASDGPSAPAGPPPLHQPAGEPAVARRDAEDADPDAGRNGKDEAYEGDRSREEPATDAVPPVATAKDTAKGKARDKAKATTPPGAVPPKVAPTDLTTMRRRERKQVAKRRARKVKRIVRRLDAWSVLKVAFIFNLCVYIVSMVAGVMLWRVADGAGVIENVESFIEDLGAFETYRFEPDLIFQAFALGGAVLAVLATGLIALGAVLFNLISDLVGGIRMTVIEEPGSLPARRRRSVGSEPEASGTVSEPSGATKA